ncbi:MAG: hypothetical protein WA948_02260 [Pontixanthobacter sp.]
MAGVLGGGTACSPAIDQPQSQTGAIPIECAVNGPDRFEPVCLVEQTTIDGGMIITVRHPNGGFRRFERVADARGLVAMDGAGTGRRIERNGALELQIADDRYRFPAIVRNEITE